MARTARPPRRAALVIAGGSTVASGIGLESRDSAASAGLRYVTDRKPGISRRRVGSGFRYVSPTGAIVRDRDELKRIGALAIPPAWRDVWICPDPRGHLQATGRDARGRKQHRYHPRWRTVRDEAKYDRILEFAAALPALRRQTSDDIAVNSLPRRKVTAAGHEAGQILEVAPESVEILYRSIDPDRLFHPDSLVAAECCARVLWLFQHAV